MIFIRHLAGARQALSWLLLAAKNSVNCQTEMPVIDFFFLHNWQLYTSFGKCCMLICGGNAYNITFSETGSLPTFFLLFMDGYTHQPWREDYLCYRTSIKGWGLEVLMVCGSSSSSLSFLHFLFCFFFGNGRKAHTMILESSNQIHWFWLIQVILSTQ